VRVPVADGVNVAEIVQLAPAAKLAGQLLLCAKSLAFVPPTAMLLIDSAALPELVNVTDWAALVDPTS
jgi:hypothetical protein